MSNLKYWQDKIKEKRKNTSFMEYIMKLTSWKPIVYYKHKGLFSRYPETSKKLNVVSNKEFNENIDSPINLDYDFGKSFFENYKTLFGVARLSATTEFNKNENSNFADCIFGAKNAYLSVTVGNTAENIFYSSFSYSNIRNIISSFFITDNTDNVYFSSTVGTSSYNIFYSRFITTSNNCWFSTNLIGCSECIFCDNLENKKYCINNKNYGKEEYFIEKKKILEQKSNFLDWYKNTTKKGTNYQSKNSTGSALYFSDNVKNGYFFVRLKNGNNVMVGDGVNGCENFYDCFDIGINSNDFYGALSAGEDGTSNIYISSEIGKSTNIFYSYYMQTCHNCIGCVGLKNKSYCILNKQYEKEEWEKMADKIFSQMDDEGILGDFLPGELNPFYFNDTIAGLIGNFTKEEVEKDGYMWRDEEIKVDIPDGSDVIQINDLGGYQGFDSNGVWKINPEILKKVIKDEKGNYYRIVQMEYDFLVKHGLPLTEIHWMDRMKLNFGV